MTVALKATAPAYFTLSTIAGQVYTLTVPSDTLFGEIVDNLTVTAGAAQPFFFDSEYQDAITGVARYLGAAVTKAIFVKED